MGIPKYIVNHSSKVTNQKDPKINEWVKREQHKHFCQCGCGEEITILRRHFWAGIPTFIHGHNQKGENSSCYKKHLHEKKLIECACGCGLLFEDRDKKGRSRQYIHGHSRVGRHHSDATKRRMGQHWEDPEFVKKMFIAWNKSPNKLEKFVDAILQKNFPNEWKYNGDFSCGISIGGMIPDFVNINGKKTIIEVFGDVFHDEKKLLKSFGGKLSWKRTEFGRNAIYSQLGYKCIILWEHELKRHDAEEFVLDKLGMINNE